MDRSHYAYVLYLEILRKSYSEIPTDLISLQGVYYVGSPKLAKLGYMYQP